MEARRGGLSRRPVASVSMASHPHLALAVPGADLWRAVVCRILWDSACVGVAVSRHLARFGIPLHENRSCATDSGTVRVDHS